MIKRWLNAHQIENIKTGILTTLVLLSFLLSGYLWYSTPASEVLKPDNHIPPYIYKSPYSNRETFELIGPFQIVAHDRNRSYMILPTELAIYKAIGKEIRRLNLNRFDTRTTRLFEMQPEKDNALQLLFMQPLPYSLIESYFGTELEVPAQYKNKLVSKVWLCKEWRNTLRISIMFENSPNMVETRVNIADSTWDKLMSVIRDSKRYPVKAISLDSFFHWNSPRSCFIPVTNFEMEELTYTLQSINMDHMKQWLFRDPKIKPLIPNSSEAFYMYNDQLLHVNRSENTMTYSDSASQPGEISITNQLDQITHFMQRHQGWTGLYVFDTLQKNNDYTFRLFNQGFPVYWDDTKGTIQPDRILLQTGKNGISNYVRSTYYLSKAIEKKKRRMLTKDELVSQLNLRGISLQAIRMIYPGYITTPAPGTEKEKRVILRPVWVISQVNGKRVFIHGLESR